MKPLTKKNLKSLDSPLKIVKYVFPIMLFFSCTLALAQDDKGFVVDEIIAKVDNYIVLKSEVDRAYQDYVAQGGSPTEEARCQYLAIIIRNKLMMAKAEIDSVVVLDMEVDANTKRRMDAILAQAGNSPDDLETRFGKTLDEIQIELRDQIREQMIVSRMEEETTKGLAVTPAEVRHFFSKIPKDSLPYFSAAVEVAQIVRVAKVSESQNEETKRLLMDLRNQILTGADFTTLARKYSADPSVAVNGGDMGFVGRGQMVPEFEAASFKLKQGEISMPVKTNYGYHIIQLMERRGNEYHSRHILIAPTPSQQDLDRASHYLDSLRELIIRDSITFKAAAKEYSDDVQSKGNGGFFMDQDGGQKIPVDELDPIVFFKIDSMKVGDVSPPIVYRTDEGKDAVRILYYKSRISPHEASLKEDWQRIQAAALNEKKSKVLQKWFAKARQDVFISIDDAYKGCGILKGD